MFETGASEVPESKNNCPAVMHHYETIPTIVAKQKEIFALQLITDLSILQNLKAISTITGREF